MSEPGRVSAYQRSQEKPIPPSLRTTTTMSESAPKQPLHPSIIPRLDPEYIEFHNKALINITPPHTLPWDPSLRNLPAVPGGSEPLRVGATQDFDLSHTKFRSFTPEGAPPANGWPVFIFFHGG